MLFYNTLCSVPYQFFFLEYYYIAFISNGGVENKIDRIVCNLVRELYLVGRFLRMLSVALL